MALQREIKQELTDKVKNKLSVFMVVEVLKLMMMNKGSYTPKDMEREALKIGTDIVDMCVATVEAGKIMEPKDD